MKSHYTQFQYGDNVYLYAKGYGTVTRVEINDSDALVYIVRMVYGSGKFRYIEAFEYELVMVAA